MMTIALPLSQLPRCMEDIWKLDPVRAMSSAPIEDISITPFRLANVLYTTRVSV